MINGGLFGFGFNRVPIRVVGSMFADFRFPSKDMFSEEIIEAYVDGAQNFKKGKALVACGDVHHLRMVQGSGEEWVYTAFVHAEMTANKNYLLKATLCVSGIRATECVCHAARNEHNRCKHVAAILLSLFLLHQHLNTPPKWITNRKRKVARMIGEDGWKINEKIKATLDWEGVKKGFEVPPPRHNGKAAVLITKQEVSKAEKRRQKEVKRKEKEKEKREKEKEKEKVKEGKEGGGEGKGMKEGKEKEGKGEEEKEGGEEGKEKGKEKEKEKEQEGEEEKGKEKEKKGSGDCKGKEEKEKEKEGGKQGKGKEKGKGKKKEKEEERGREGKGKGKGKKKKEKGKGKEKKKEKEEERGMEKKEKGKKKEKKKEKGKEKESEKGKEKKRKRNAIEETAQINTFRKKRRQEIIYPSHLIGASEVQKEKWRVEQIYKEFAKN